MSKSGPTINSGASATEGGWKNGYKRIAKDGDGPSY